jgi:hypothetical protein
MTTQTPRIFSTDSAKAAKATGFGYLNAIHYMAPADTGGVGNLCPNASPQCKALCLGVYSGQAAMVADLENGTNSVRESRKSKARMFMHARNYYLNLIALEIVAIERKAAKDGLVPVIRLNGSTDIPWERIRFTLEPKTAKAIGYQFGWQALPNALGQKVTLIELFRHLQFVDYTKSPQRLARKPANLDLTLSYSVTNSAACIDALSNGHNVAMIFAGGLPESFAGFPVIDGDIHDLRHLDPKGGYIVGLSPKGNKAKKDASGFVVRWQDPSGQALQWQWRALRSVAAEKRLAAAIDSGELQAAFAA